MGSISYPYYDNSEKRTNYVEQQPNSTTSSASTTNEDFVVFTEGLTRQQVESANKTHLTNLFAQYNKDGDDVISHDEFQVFFKENVETSWSKTRVATGGKYIVQSGDTLSAIAHDFRTTAYELYKMNKEVIGNDINKIQIGMELVIFDYMQVATDHECDHVHEDEHVHEGEETSSCPENHSCDFSKEYTEKVLSNHQNRVDFCNILRTLKPECKDMSPMEVMKEFYKLDNKQKQEFFDKTLMQMGIDVHKADLSIVDGCVEEFLAQSPEGYTIHGKTIKTIKTIEDYNNLDFFDQAEVRRNALEARLEKDLADGNPN
ncbi:LysM peptidoglycan-binding domain-containing protein, partial [bacterium]|nr:LysM peptidoglycan-binding domain-containing protein [bacterium]